MQALYDLDQLLREPGMVLVSACLAGVCCRYDGASAPHAGVLELVRRGKALPVCPEQLGGLPTPRVRHERTGDRVVSELGVDATALFRRGAQEALRLAQLARCRVAILKARSPSCGVGSTYDGTFRAVVIPQDGILAELLRQHGIRVLTDEQCAASEAGAEGS